MEKQYKNILPLFLTFLKIGAFTFGGGYAMIPLIQKEVVEKRKWISNQDILDIIAIAESTPGPIAINAATFIGYKRAHFLGALCTTIGVVLPSFVIIVTISFVLKQFESIKIIQYAFNGIRVGVLALIIQALISMYKQCPKNLFSYIVMVVVFISVAFLNLNIIIAIIGCAIFGIITSVINDRRIKQ